MNLHGACELETVISIILIKFFHSKRLLDRWHTSGLLRMVKRGIGWASV